VGKARQPVRPSALLVGALLSLTAFLALAAPAAQQHWFEAERVARAQVGLVRGPALGDAMVAVSALGQASGLVPLIAPSGPSTGRDRTWRRGDSRAVTS
jgi:hypothetical protein